MKRPTLAVTEKSPVIKAATAKFKATIPEASLNKDSFSNVSITFCGTWTLAVIEETATASVGVIIAAKLIAKAVGKAGHSQEVNPPATKIVRIARTIAKEIIALKWRLKLK